MSDDVTIQGLRSLDAVLERLPQGASARTLARQLGLWSTEAHRSASSGRTQIFPTRLSDMTEGQLSDTYAYWLSEVFRSTELVGLLEGQNLLLDLESRSVRARARSRARTALRSESAKSAGEGRAVKEPTAAAVADAVEEDANVMTVDSAIGMLGVVLASAKAYKEACLAGTAGLSREISLRQAQMNAKLR